MFCLEERIRPKPVANAWPHDVLGSALVLCLAGTLAACWRVSPGRHFSDIVGQMFSFYLLPTLGFALALRCGAIDLSVWAVSGLGGVIAAGLLRHGAGPGASFAAALGAGLAVGAVQGLAVARLRIPSPIVTLIAAAAIVLALTTAFEDRSLDVADTSFEPWLSVSLLPPYALRMLLVALTYLAALFGILAVSTGVRLGQIAMNPRAGLFASLCLSGGLSGLAGAIWLLDHGTAPVPSRIIGDLRVPAAAVLAGAAFFAGRGRSGLVALCVPACLLAATIWQVGTVHLAYEGYALQTVLLLGMTLATHAGMNQLIKVRGKGRALAGLSTILLAAGMVVLAMAAGSERLAAWRACQTGGIVTWVAGAALLLVSRAFGEPKAPSAPPAG